MVAAGGDTRPGRPGRSDGHHPQPHPADLGAVGVRRWPSSGRTDGRPRRRRRAGPTIAFLASGIEGIKVRLTAKAATEAAAEAVLGEEEARHPSPARSGRVRRRRRRHGGAVGRLLLAAGLTLGVAESLTGGLVGSRFSAVPGRPSGFGARSWPTPARSNGRCSASATARWSARAAAREMAAGAATALGADVGLALTGVAGPTEQDGQPVGTVWVGLAIGGDSRTPSCSAWPAAPTGTRSARSPPSPPSISCAATCWNVGGA